MSKMIIVTDDGEVKNISMANGDRPSNAYASFPYGGNGRSEAEARSEAQAAAKQKAREDKAYQ